MKRQTEEVNYDPQVWYEREDSTNPRVQYTQT